MAGRIRSLLPELLDDEVMASLSSDAWRIAVSLVLLADDHGNVRFAPRYIAANVFQDTGRDVDDACRELADRGVVVPYVVAGQRYAHLNGWRRDEATGRFRQRVDNAGLPRVPGPEKAQTSNRAVATSSAESLSEARTTSEPRGEVAGQPEESRLDLRSPISISDHERDRARARGPALTLVTGMPLPDELRATFDTRAMNTGSRLDVDAEWRKFVDNRIAGNPPKREPRTAYDTLDQAKADWNGWLARGDERASQARAQTRRTGSDRQPMPSDRPAWARGST